MLLTKWQHLVTKEKYTVGKTGNHKHIKIAAIFPRHSWSSNRLNKAKQQVLYTKNCTVYILRLYEYTNFFV